MTRRRAALGLRAKTGRAIAVVLAEAENGPEVVYRGELETWDPEIPDSFHPHHAGLELDPAAAGPVVRGAEKAVQLAARAALGELLSQLSAGGYKVAGAGLVGSPAKDPDQLALIGSPHVRAHAAEGQLFRSVLEKAARSRRLPCTVLSDRAGFEQAAERMAIGEKLLRGQADELGKGIGPPWRADHKLACAAALLVLAES